MKYLILFLCSITFFACSKKWKRKHCDREYHLEHPVSIYPVQNSYNIGDTIWVDINLSNKFNAEIIEASKDSPYFQEITLENFDFHRNYIFISKLTDSTQSYQSQNAHVWSNFNYILQKGFILSEDELGPEYKLEYSNNQYSFKLGIIPIISGRYLIQLHRNPYYTSPDQMEYNEQDILPDCDNEIITKIKFPINKQINGSYNNNYNVFTEFMNPYLENDIDRIKQYTFNFKVN